MIQLICIILIISGPFVRLGASLAKDKSSSGIVAAFIVAIGSLIIFYYAGLFTLLLSVKP